MLSVSQVTNAGAGASYYQADNYYAKDSAQGQGVWYGKASADLGLEGKTATPEAFKAVLSGELPNGQKLYRMVGGEKVHIAGYDMTFSAPKSVSIMSEIVGDARYGDAHQKAVTATLNWVEAKALMTRKYDRSTGKQAVVGGQSMVAALFTHDISRNEDPQLHTHCVVANATLGPDGKYRSVHSPELFRQKMLIGEIYRSELKSNIRDAALGHIGRTHMDGRFELADMRRDIIEMFSTRSADIKDYLGEGAHSAEDKANAAVKTRRGKREVSREDLKANWDKRLAGLGQTKGSVAASLDTRAARQAQDKSPLPNAEQGLTFAVEHLSETQSTFAHQDVLRFALAESRPCVRIGDVETALSEAVAHGWLKTAKNGKSFYTRETLDRERAILSAEQSGRGSVDPVLPRASVKTRHQGSTLEPDQLEAASLILTSANRTIGIQGLAGTGKTFMLQSAARQIEGAGYTVLGLAPSKSAERSLSGGAGVQTQTLQKYLLSPSGDHKTVLLVDEASMVSTHQMQDLLNITAKRGLAKVVLIGDSKQLEGVGAGAPFKALQANGMHHAVMDTVKRQAQDRHRDAVIGASNGDITHAFEKLGDDIRQVPLGDLAKGTADAWLNSPDRNRAGIVTTTNAMVDAINAHVKAGLIREGTLSPETHTLTRLKPLRMTDAQSGYADNYREADAVQFTRDYKRLGVKRGDILSVDRVRDNGVVELSRNGKQIDFRPNRDARGSGAVEAFQNVSMTLNPGDVVRWIRPDADTGIANRDHGKISRISETHVTFTKDNGTRTAFAKDDPTLGFMTHAWAQTGHAFQGRTIDHIVVGMPSLSGLTDQKSFYVDISRARHEITLVTDNVERLHDALSERTGASVCALDLWRETQKDRLQDSTWMGQLDRQDEKVLEAEQAEKAMEMEQDRSQSVDFGR